MAVISAAGPLVFGQEKRRFGNENEGMGPASICLSGILFSSSGVIRGNATGNMQRLTPSLIFYVGVAGQKS
jgi:hypothetical protein